MKKLLKMVALSAAAALLICAMTVCASADEKIYTSPSFRLPADKVNSWLDLLAAEEDTGETETEQPAGQEAVSEEISEPEEGPAEPEEVTEAPTEAAEETAEKAEENEAPAEEPAEPGEVTDVPAEPSEVTEAPAEPETEAEKPAEATEEAEPAVEAGIPAEQPEETGLSDETGDAEAPAEPETENSEPVRQVRITSSQGPTVTEGEIIYLTGELIGFEGLNVSYQWQVDRGDGAGWTDIDGATRIRHMFVASRETIEYSWRLIVNILE